MLIIKPDYFRLVCYRIMSGLACVGSLSAVSSNTQCAEIKFKTNVKSVNVNPHTPMVRGLEAFCFLIGELGH